MESNPVFETVKELLRQGDTGQALDVLIQYLEKETSQISSNTTGGGV